MPLDDDEAGDAERGLPDEGAGQAPSGDGEPDWPGDEAGPADGDADADRAASDDAAVLHSGDDDGAAEADAAADADTDPAAAGERAGLPGFLTVGRDGADWAGDAGPEHQDFAEPEDAADPWQDGEAALAPSEPDPAAADGGDGAAETDATLDWSEYDDSAIRAAAFEDDDDAVAVAPETLRDIGAAAGTVAEPAAGDDGQPAAAGNDGQPAVAGDDGQPAVAGDDGQPAAAGDDGQPAVAGDGGQPAAGENAPEQPAVAGGPADHGAASGAAAAASASRRLHLSADPGTGGEAAGRPAAAAAGTPDEDKMASPRAAGTDDAILLDEPGEEAILDEDTLRDLVSQVVREELMGELGERITRNVKKLVRREIQRALAGREFD
jgi:hypothetical protein